MKSITKSGIAIIVCFLLISQYAVAQYKSIRVNTTQLRYNQNALIPFKKLDQLNIAVVVPDNRRYIDFVNTLQRYAEISQSDLGNFSESTKLFNTIIVAGQRDELTQDVLLQVQQAGRNGKNIILCQFSPELTDRFIQTPRFGGHVTELVAKSLSKSDQENAAMSIFGGLAITEGLPQQRTEQTRLQYVEGDPSTFDIAGMTKKIDLIAQEAISQRAAPGMVVMAVKDGQVIFEKAYGHHTYEGAIRTRTSDIFDLASISKIVGTTPVIMHLQEEKKINLDSTIGDYLWDARETNKANISLRTVLLHEAGFTPYIPFYRNLKKGDLQPFASSTHQVKVADNAYLLTDYYKNVMWPEMLKSAVKPTGNYVYSDISMYVMKEIAEQVSSTAMQDYIQQILYRPIGMKSAGYNPRERFDRNRIVPTENDTSFRKVLLEGYVHDQGAAMAGGVAGHAGVFSTANDLAIYGQLLLNRGEYGGVRYLRAETVDLFTSKQSRSSRRGLGFDRADPDQSKGYPSKFANSAVYGHTGYTGTCIWIDPKNQLIYIFLSNRVHPQVSTKLLDLNIRSRIQDAIYETILQKH